MHGDLGFISTWFFERSEVVNKKGEKIMTKRFGFTLAEVLITLGIIGVVAAMTMPTLINQTNGAQYKAAYKKALSSISQGITLNVALDDRSFYDTTAGTAGSNTTANSIANILSNRMNVVKVTTQVGYSGAGTSIITNGTTIADGSSNTTLFFNDGSVFQFIGTAAGCTAGDAEANITANRCRGFIDVNGLKGPNKVVKCDSASGNCSVKSPTDIYPVVFYDQTVLPNSKAARAVLYGK